MNDCDTVAGEIDRYLTGQLSDYQASSLEEHAAGCERCSDLLERNGRLGTTWPIQIAPPPSVRAAVLGAIAARPASRSARRWIIPTTLAAGIFLTVMLSRPADKAALVRERATRNVAELAEQQARPEFDELDRASSDLRAALASSPGNPAIEAALERIETQRRQLANLVKEFTS